MNYSKEPFKRDKGLLEKVFLTSIIGNAIKSIVGKRRQRAPITFKERYDNILSPLKNKTEK